MGSEGVVPEAKNRLRILVVDDEINVRERIQDIARLKNVPPEFLRG